MIAPISACQCAAPGLCPLAGRRLQPALHRACREASAEQRARLIGGLRASVPRPANNAAAGAVIPPAPTGGVGTELARIAAWIGQKPAANCHCLWLSRIMDRRGVAWCELHFDRLLALIDREAQRRELPLPLWRPYFIRLALKKAIRRARRAAALNPPQPGS